MPQIIQFQNNSHAADSISQNQERGQPGIEIMFVNESTKMLREYLYKSSLKIAGSESGFLIFYFLCMMRQILYSEEISHKTKLPADNQ